MAKRMKIVLQIPVARPRNPYVVLALNRRAGTHRKSRKNERQEWQREKRSIEKTSINN